MLSGILQVLHAPKDWPNIRPNSGAHGLPVRLLTLWPKRSDEFCAELGARVLEARPDAPPLGACELGAHEDRAAGEPFWIDPPELTDVDEHGAIGRHRERRRAPGLPRGSRLQDRLLTSGLSGACAGGLFAVSRHVLSSMPSAEGQTRALAQATAACALNQL
jgi:hypothetical protein